MCSRGLVKCAVDSTKLLTGSADNFCKLWDVKTGVCLHTWKHTVRRSFARTPADRPADRPFRLHLDHGCASVSQAPVRSVGFALGDKKFLTVLDNIMGNTATIFVWDLELDNLANHPDCPLLTIQGHQAKINRALWGPLNEQLYSCSDDATLRLWDSKTGKQTMCIDDVHSKRISDMQFSWDMTLLVTSCLDNWVRLFDAKTLNLLKYFDSERPLNSACISPLANCPYLIAGGGQDAMSVTTTSSKQGKVHPPLPLHPLPHPRIPSLILTPLTPLTPLTHPYPPSHPPYSSRRSSSTMSTTTSSRASLVTSGRSTRSPSRRTADPTRAAARTATCASPTSRRTTLTPSPRRPPRPLAGHGRRRSR